jgi:hypothetical protein
VLAAKVGCLPVERHLPVRRAGLPAVPRLRVLLTVVRSP